MATGGMEEHEDIFDCVICLSYMMDRNPRSLSCLHTFCEDCLKQLIDNRRIRCPTCREITKLKSNNVQELKVNFMLHKFKDIETKGKSDTQEKMGKTDEKNPKSPCQICGERLPVYKCKDCPQLMCQSCKNEHNVLFKDHAVFNMCDKHLDGITHLCKKCIRPLCMKCAVLDHKEHRDDFVEYTKGVKDLQDEVKTLHSSIKEQVVNIESHLKQTDSNHAISTEIEKGLATRRLYHTGQIKEIDELSDIIKKKTIEYEKIKKQSLKSKHECNIRTASLKALENDTPGYCTKYSQLKPRAEQVLADVQKQLQVNYNPPPFVLRKYQQTSIADHITYIQPGLKKLRKERLVVDIQRSDDINCQEQIAFIGSDVVLVTYEDPQHIIRLNHQGRVVARYYPEMMGKEVNGVAVHDDQIYIVQDRAITVISQRCDTNTVIYKPNTYRNDKILVRDKSTFFISDGCYQGKIYKYNTESKKTEVMVEVLNDPSYMSVMYTKEGPRYIVTEYITHKVHIYNQNWELLTMFGGPGSDDRHLHDPCANAVTETGILVADSGNSRISHYSMEGDFLCHVITDNLNEPIGMAYKHPYLWVCGDDDYVKCFEVKYQ